MFPRVRPRATPSYHRCRIRSIGVRCRSHWRIPPTGAEGGSEPSSPTRVLFAYFGGPAPAQEPDSFVGGTSGSNLLSSSAESAANPESLDQAVLISGVLDGTARIPFPRRLQLTEPNLSRQTAKAGAPACTGLDDVVSTTASGYAPSNCRM
jgi:hypothetical protein